MGANYELEREVRETNRLLRKLISIARGFEHQTESVGVRFTGASTMNNLILAVGQSSIGTISPLEADGLTVTPGAVVSAQSFSISDPSLTSVTNSDGTVTITGVTPSTAPVTGTVSATVTDPDNTVNTFTQTITVTVTGAPTGRTASIVVDFSAPTPPASSAKAKKNSSSTIDG